MASVAKFRASTKTIQNIKLCVVRPATSASSLAEGAYCRQCAAQISARLYPDCGNNGLSNNGNLHEAFLLFLATALAPIVAGKLCCCIAQTLFCLNPHGPYNQSCGVEWR